MSRCQSPVLRFLLVLLGMGCLLGGGTVDASGASRSSLEQELERVVSGPEDRIALADTLLFISQKWEPGLDPEPLREKLDRLTEAVDQKITPSSSPDELVRALTDTLHGEFGYRYTESVDAQGIPKNPDELFLHGLLQTGRGYCMNLSLLYLIVAERLDLPLYGVPLPNHFFVRYDDGTTQINIEATEKGALYPDRFYRERFNVPESSSYFMNNLGPRGTLGAYFSNVGMVYYRNQKPEEAVLYLQASTSINSHSLEAHNNLANVFAEQKRWDAAIRHYQRALEADPDHLATLYNLGQTYRQVGKDQKAIDAILQALQVDPFFSPGHQALFDLFVGQKRFYGALLHLKKLAAMNPQNVDVQVQVARFYLRLGQAPLALNALRRIRQVYPDHPAVLEALAETHYRMEQWDRAVHLYRYLIEHQREYLKAYVQLGWTYYRKGDPNLASAWTKRGLNLGRGSEEIVTLAHMNLGFYALLQQNYDEARDWYAQALEEGKDPDRTVKGLIQDIEEAQRNRRDRPDLEFFKGWIYVRSGHPGRAERSIRHYLERDPEGPLAEDARSLLEQISGQSPPPGEPEPETPSAEAHMVRVPAGFFIMGSNNGGDDEFPEHRVYLDEYFIDQHEVTAADYAEFLNAVNNTKGYYLDNKFGTLYYDGRFHARKGLESYPVNNVNWQGAQEYCRWRDKRLPTEAEWEKAARGTDKRRYPWGNDPPNPERARFFQTWTPEIQHRVMVPVDGLPGGKSPYGAYHMAGNVKEWVDDWYDPEYYRDASSHINPEGPIGGEFKVLRGGSWRDFAGFLHASFRNNSFPGSRLDDYGFRCAKSAVAQEPSKKLIRWNRDPSRLE